MDVHYVSANDNATHVPWFLGNALVVLSILRRHVNTYTIFVDKTKVCIYICICIYVRVNPRTSVSTSISQRSPNFHVPPSLPSSPNSNIFLRTRTVEPSFQSIPGNSMHGIILERTCLRYSTFHARVPNHVISISKQTLEGRTTPLLRDDSPQNTFVFKLFQKLFNSYDDTLLAILSSFPVKLRSSTRRWNLERATPNTETTRRKRRKKNK